MAARLDIRKDGAGWWLWRNLYSFHTYRFYWREPQPGVLELDITGMREGTWNDHGFLVHRERSTTRRTTVEYAVEQGFNALDEPTWVLKPSTRGVFDQDRAADLYGLEGSRAPRPRNPWAFKPGSRVRHV